MRPSGKSALPQATTGDFALITAPLTLESETRKARLRLRNGYPQQRHLGSNTLGRRSVVHKPDCLEVTALPVGNPRDKVCDS